MTAHAFLLAWAAAANSATFDEPAHLAAGVEYWEHRDFSIYSLSPPLLRLWAGLPAVIAGANAPGTDDVKSQVIAQRHWGYADAFTAANLPRFAGLLLLARLGMIPISCFAGIVTYLWAYRLYGWRGAVAACAIYCVNPGILANASLVTTDTGTAAAMLASCWLWWKFCRAPRLRAWVLVLAAVVAAHLCKFTGVLLWPMLLAMSVPFIGCGAGSAKTPTLTLPSSSLSLGAEGRRTGGGGKRSRNRGLLLGAWLGLGVGTLLLVNAVYGFRGTFQPLGSFHFESEFMRHVQRTLPAGTPSPLPRTIVLGFDAQKQDSGVGYEGFLFGEIYRGARWYFFPVALLCKSPVALVLLFLVAISTAFMRRLRRAEWSILLAIGVFAVGVMVLGDLNIGTRYLLPIFPLGFILISRVWSRGSGGPLRKFAAVLVLVSAAETLWVSPRFLTFINFAAGGTNNGWRVLNNSDFDWGQGLIDLRNWMRENNVQSVQLAYFGFVDPRAYGIEYTPFTARSDAPIFAVSSYALDGMQQRILTAYATREWIQLKFYRQLQRKKPIAVVGNTIFIYSRVDVESAVSEYLGSRSP